MSLVAVFTWSDGWSCIKKYPDDVRGMFKTIRGMSERPEWVEFFNEGEVEYHIDLAKWKHNCYHQLAKNNPTKKEKTVPQYHPPKSQEQIMPQGNLQIEYINGQKTTVSCPPLSDRNLFLAALDNSRSHHQQLIAQVGLAWITTLLKKNADYGSSIFKEPILAPGMPTTSAIDVRMSDKIARIQNLKTAKAEVVSESIDDTYDDLGSYCLLRKVAVLIEKENKS